MNTTGDLLMAKNSDYKKLEKEIIPKSKQIQVSDINIEWNVKQGTCNFENLPVAMMWVDTTLAGLMSGVQSMVGTERFGLALQSEGRKSVEDDWKVISQFADFEEGFKAIANIAAVAGWGDWKLISLDKNKQECHFRVNNSWEGRYQKSLGVCWGSGMLAGKMAGYCSKLFRTNCWAKQTRFIADEDDVDEFIVGPSERFIEDEIENLLLTDEATRADMAVALQKLRREVNERKHAEKELRESMERYRAFFERGPDGVVVLEPETAKPIEFNDQACRQLGYSREEFAQLRVPDIEVKETAEETQARIQKVLKEGYVDFETLQRTKHGDIRHVHVTAQMIEIAGRPVYHSIWRDVTERKQLEEVLRDDAVRWRILVEQSRDGIVVLDENGKVYESNQQFANMLGYTIKEVHQLHVWDWDAQWTKNQLMQMIQEIDEIGDYFETLHLRKDGTLLDVEISTNGAVYRGQKLVFCVCRDITQRKQAEEALQESESRYSALFNGITDAVFVHHITEDGAPGKIIDVNHVACNMLGYTKDELIGMEVGDIDDPESTVDVHHLVENLKDGRNALFEQVHVAKDGRRIPVEIHSQTFEYKDRLAILSTVRDITDRKLAEQEKKKLEEQLQQAQKMEAIGTLAGGIAHDFNNILGIILGNTELALDDVPEWNPACYNLKEVRTASIRAKDVVRQLMSFARKTELDKKPTNITPIVKESLKMLRATIPTSIDIRQHISDDVDTILADSTQINQVLINLCTNAHHAMPEGGIIDVTLENTLIDESHTTGRPDMAPGKYVHLIVSDTGHGIPEENFDQIFDPYFTTKDVGKGSGMGLAVVHGIVKDHGAIIKVESEIGKGTIFDIFFPAVEQEAIVDIATDEELPTGNEKILFVDDENSIVKLGRQRFERLGYKVEATTDPTEALTLFQSKPDYFDLVITDMTMPDMTGDKLAEKLLGIRSDIPIILCTGFSEKIDESRAKAMGIADYIEKPFGKRDFAFKVRKVLNEAKRSD